MSIVINIAKAKSIAHDIRRASREKDFKPFDDAISKQIPDQLENAEANRQLIREKYAVMQTAIDSSNTLDEIKEILSNNS